MHTSGPQQSEPKDNEEPQYAVPKIGTRPVIDDRWSGVNEGLEAQTMNKALLESLHYPDFTPGQAMVAHMTIGGGAESALCEEYFATENVVATLTVTLFWCYGMETFGMNPLTVKAIWGFNGMERPGAVYLAAVLAACAQKGLPAFSIYGCDVRDATDAAIPDDVREKIVRFARCAVAVGWMRNKAYIILAACRWASWAATAIQNAFQKYFGIRIEWVDMTEIQRRMKLAIYDPAELSALLCGCEPTAARASLQCGQGVAGGHRPH